METRPTHTLTTAYAALTTLAIGLFAYFTFAPSQPSTANLGIETRMEAISIDRLTAAQIHDNSRGFVR